MKSRLTLFFLLIAFVAHSQYDYYYDGPMFGVGLGYNFTSIVGDDVRPFEVSFRYRINNKSLLQLYLPLLMQDDSFGSKRHPEMELINTSLDSKKCVYGIGLDYDYVLQSYSSLDFVIGLRGEYQHYRHKTNLTNRYASSSSINVTELSYSNKENGNFIVSPNAGFSLNLNRFAVDAKFLLSMLSIKGDVDNRIERQKGVKPNITSTTKEWSDEISNNFKLKPAIMMSMSYFF